MEAAPGTITSGRARQWAAAGINRVSLACNRSSKKRFGEPDEAHGGDCRDRDGTAARGGNRQLQCGFDCGLSGQTEASWHESLEWVERLQPKHVSVYMLEVDEDSRLGKEMLLGGVRYGADQTPSDDQTAAFYETAVERLTAMGIARYEISNFGRPGFESRHNLKYWKLEPYAGFGADAHSFDGRVRRQNPESIDEYVTMSGDARARNLCRTSASSWGCG